MEVRKWKQKELNLNKKGFSFDINKKNKWETGKYQPLTPQWNKDEPTKEKPQILWLYITQKIDINTNTESSVYSSIILNNPTLKLPFLDLKNQNKIKMERK